jgi:hypothetical protein
VCGVSLKISFFSSCKPSHIDFNSAEAPLKQPVNKLLDGSVDLKQILDGFIIPIDLMPSLRTCYSAWNGRGRLSAA